MRGLSLSTFLVFVFAVVFFGGVPYVRAAALSATQSPTAAVSAGPPGTGWSSSTLVNALVVDGAEAKLTSAMPLSSASQLLVLTGFNFAIPADATITGVAVSVTRRSTSNSGAFIQDAVVELVGGFGTSTSLARADAWPATLAAATYGDASTLWSASLTPADVNSAAFGFALAVQNTDPVSAHNAHVDGATMSVYYALPDTTPPAIDTPADLPGNEAAGATGGAVNFSLPAASDEGGIASESCTPASGSMFALGSTTVTCTAADAAGNSASSHFDIGVVDTTPPVITLAAGTSGGTDLTLALVDAFVDPGYAAIDSVDGSDTVTVGGDTVNTAVAGSYSITYNAVDTAGNHAAQKTRIVTVLPAALGAPQAIAVGTSAPTSATYGSTFDVAASADSGLSVVITASGSCSGAGVAAATITATSGIGDCTVSYSQAGDAAYAPAAQVTETVAAQKALLRLTVSNTTKQYGEEAAFDGAFSFDGGTSLHGSDTVTGITKTSAGVATSSSVAGSPYAIVPSDAVGTGLDNYDITYISGSLTVLPAPLSISANNQSKTFGDPDPTVTYAHGALVGGDTEAVFSGTLSRDIGEDVGAYAIGEGTLVAGDNYAVSFTGAELTILPAAEIAGGNPGSGSRSGSRQSSNRPAVEISLDNASPVGTSAQSEGNVGTGHPSADVEVPVEAASPRGTEGSAFNIGQPRQRVGKVLGAATTRPSAEIANAVEPQSPKGTEGNADQSASQFRQRVGNIGTWILNFLKFLGKALHFQYISS